MNPTIECLQEKDQRIIFINNNFVEFFTLGLFFSVLIYIKREFHPLSKLNWFGINQVNIIFKSLKIQQKYLKIYNSMTEYFNHYLNSFIIIHI